MANNDYQTLLMSHYMLREFQEQRKQQEEASMEPPAVGEYQHFPDEALAYPIFSNHACGQQNARELLAASSDTNYGERWRFFYSPDPLQLPHINYQQQLEQEVAALQQRLRTLNSPRLILFASTFFMVIFLVMRGHFMLPAIPIIALAWYWYVSEVKIHQTQAQLRQHHHEWQVLTSQTDKIAQQLDNLPRPAGLEHMQQQYQLAVEHLFRNTLLQTLAPHELGDLALTLKNRQWEGFITESWGYLQTPLAAQSGSAIKHLLLDANHVSLSALQPDPHGRKGHNLYRVQYLHVWILTQRGLLMGQGYYDRVANQFLSEEQEFYPYARLTHIHLAEQPTPELPVLQECLPERIYQRHFGQPVSILTVGAADGKTYECASLPVSERPFRQTEWRDRYELDADMQRLNRRLHERVYGTATTMAS